MKNQDKVSSHTRLSEARGRSKCPQAIFLSHFNRAEQETLDTGVQQDLSQDSGPSPRV